MVDVDLIFNWSSTRLLPDLTMSKHSGCVIRNMEFLPFAITCVQPGFYWVHVAHLFSINGLEEKLNGATFLPAVCCFREVEL